jgi:ABC-type arginine transport system permease subunit
VIAVLIGIAAATGSRVVDGIINWVIDLVMGVPHLVLIILISFACGRGLTGLLAGIAAVDEDSDLMMITDQGTIIRTPAKDISILSRSAGGVIVMRLPEGQYVANFTIVAKEEEKDSEEDEDILEETLEEVTDTEAVEVEIPVEEESEAPADEE